MSELYRIHANNNKNESIELEKYRGHVLLIVNTASKCGFTPQYDGLQNLYKKYHAQGFEVLAFPCNQFGHQEPGSDEEIASFCSMNFNTTFPIFAKVDVNGDNAHPLFDYLKTEAPGILGTKAIKWNFTKFLINRRGQVIKRYAPNDKPEDLENDIIHTLNEKLD